MRVESRSEWRRVWAEKSVCGEMWVGAFRDHEKPNVTYYTEPAGDHDTAIFFASRESEMLRCSSSCGCHDS